jgi:hypothetical protein
MSLMQVNRRGQCNGVDPQARLAHVLPASPTISPRNCTDCSSAIGSTTSPSRGLTITPHSLACADVQPRQRVDRSVGAVRSRKGIVDVNVSEFGKSARDRASSLLPLCGSEGFREGHLFLPQRGNDTLRFVADAILGKNHRSAADCGAQWRDQVPEGKSRISRSLRPTEMRHHDNFGTPVEKGLDCSNRHLARWHCVGVACHDIGQLCAGGAFSLCEHTVSGVTSGENTQ